MLNIMGRRWSVRARSMVIASGTSLASRDKETEQLPEAGFLIEHALVDRWPSGSDKHSPHHFPSLLDVASGERVKSF